MEKYDIPKDNICQVLARDEDKVEKDDSSESEDDEPKKKAFGIGELMEKTINKIEAAVESANYQFTKYHILLKLINIWIAFQKKKN